MNDNQHTRLKGFGDALEMMGRVSQGLSPWILAVAFTFWGYSVHAADLPMNHDDSLSRVKYSKTLQALTPSVATEVAQRGVVCDSEICSLCNAGNLEEVSTLRLINFTEHGNAFSADWRQGAPTLKKVTPDPKLQYIIDIFESVDDNPLFTRAGSFNPARFIRAVNALVPAGKETVLAAVKEYMRISPDPPINIGVSKVGALLRILFDPPIGYDPRIRYLTPLPEPVSPRTLPRFPIVLVDNVPVFSVDALAPPGLSGDVMSRDQDDFIDTLEHYATFRSQPLAPPSNPLVLLDKLIASEDWYWSSKCRKETITTDYDQWLSEAMQETMHQLLRLVLPVYPNARKFFASLGPDDHYILRRDKDITLSDWHKCVREVSALHLRWNSKRDKYEAFP